MRIRKLVAGIVLTGGASFLGGGLPTAHAAEAVVPLAETKAAPDLASIASALTAAQRAEELGLPTIAISLYQPLLDVPGADRPALTLRLATALLDAGRAPDAERLLQAAPGNRPPEWRLRVGLAAAQQKRWDEAREQANAINVDQLQRPDRAWFWFLQAVIADAAVPRDLARANDNYNKAQREAPSEMALATFLAEGLRVRLTLVSYTAADIEQARQSYAAMERSGSQQKYRFAELYATMRAAAGASAEAVRFLREVLLSAPRSERQAVDELRRLIGMIGNRARGGEGREALTQLLETGSSPEFQRQALLLLARDSEGEPERGLFRAELDKLIGAAPKSAILDALLLIRAQLALGDSLRDYATAERRAKELIDSFPGSPLRPHAFAVLASSAWEQKRYRVAADNARQAREVLASLPAAASATEGKVIAQAVAEFRVLEAEARFRAGDYRLAADAYAAALREAPAGIPPGDLMFQRALAAIRADANDPKLDLAKIIDELEADPRFDVANRWEAEWSLARGLNLQGKTEEAIRRITRLLDSAEANSAGVTPELRARMTWLQLRLSVEAGHPEMTLQLFPKLAGATVNAPPALREQILSTGALLRAQAEFALNQEAAAIETLKKLRAEFPKTDSAAQSFLIEADHYAASPRDKIQEAQTTLQRLIENPEYQNSARVPEALFRFARFSERLGQEKDLEEANKRIEALVAHPAASPDLVFTARLEQGEILRNLNQFPQAQRAYEDLVNNPRYAKRPDVVVAQLRLAECHNAQSSTDPAGVHADRAQSLFEELLYRVSAPPDVRIEAGFNLGKMLERRGQFDKARDIWWRGVLQPFLIDLPPGAARGARGPFWLAKTMVALGSLLEDHEKIDEARRVYVLLRDSNLGYGEATAIEGLQRLGAMSPAVAEPVTRP